MKTGIDQVLQIAAAKAENPRSLGHTEVARSLGVSPQAVQAWAKQGWVPIKRCAEIERLYGVPAMFLMSKRHYDLLTQIADANK